MPTWQLQEAKAKFSEVIDLVEQDAPQIITKRGVKVAVIIPFAAWKQEQEAETLTALDVLRSGPLFAIPLPRRGRRARRKPVEL